MNSIRRAIAGERKRLLKLYPMSIVQEQHACYSTSRKASRALNSSKIRAPGTPILPPEKISVPSNEAVPGTPILPPEKISVPSNDAVPGTPILPPEKFSVPSNDAVLNEPVIWSKPSEIPWQAKVVNSVNLIGRVKIPVQFEASSDGKSWAGTIISQDDGSESSSSLTSFWIPVIFEGDMAHIAMCHLKEKDYVHVAGHLSVDVPPFKLSEVQANVQVMAHSINFVQKFQSKKPSTLGELDRWATKNSGIVATLENNAFPQQSFKEPESISMQQDTSFKKSTRDVAFDEDSYDAKSSSVDNLKETRHVHSGHKYDKQSILALWRDLLTNPKHWGDNREDKLKGLVKANYPDFKHKDTRAGLWLDKAPAEVLQGLGQLEFFRFPKKGEKVNDGDPWKDLIKNPNKWWDNRENKKNEKGPDFKNKDSGKALWLGDAPSWALSSLPPLKAKTVNVNTKTKWASY